MQNSMMPACDLADTYLSNKKIYRRVENLRGSAQNQKTSFCKTEIILAINRD